MTRIATYSLSVARPVIQVLTVLNLGYALVIALLFAASFFKPGWPQSLGYDPAAMDPQLPIALRAFELVGLAVLACVHIILRRLLAIVGSVREGEAFTNENASRIGVIALGLVVIELLRATAAAILAAVGEQWAGVGFSLSPWLAALMLLVLAGVFASGARMRADLEGTV